MTSLNSQKQEEKREQLRKQMLALFSIEDLKDICFDLDIEYEKFEANGKGGMIRELIIFCLRTGQIDTLIEKCKKLRPAIFKLDWTHEDDNEEDHDEEDTSDLTEAEDGYLQAIKYSRERNSSEPSRNKQSEEDNIASPIITNLFTHLTKLSPQNATTQTRCEISKAILLSLKDLAPLEKRQLLILLHEKQLITKNAPIITLRGSDFTDSDLRNIALPFDDLSRINMHNVDLADSDFHNAILNMCILDDANLIGSNLENVDMRRASLRFAFLRHANLTSAQLNTSDLVGADVSYACLSWANLSYTALHGCDLIKTDFSRAVLDRAMMLNTTAKEANFQGASMKHTDLTSSDLSSANLTRADMSDCRLNGAILSGATMVGAIVTFEILNLAILDNETILPSGHKYDPERPLSDQLA